MNAAFLKNVKRELSINCNKKSQKTFEILLLNNLVDRQLKLITTDRVIKSIFCNQIMHSFVKTSCNILCKASTS